MRHFTIICRGLAWLEYTDGILMNMPFSGEAANACRFCSQSLGMKVSHVCCVISFSCESHQFSRSGFTCFPLASNLIIILITLTVSALWLRLHSLMQKLVNLMFLLNFLLIQELLLWLYWVDSLSVENTT